MGNVGSPCFLEQAGGLVFRGPRIWRIQMGLKHKQQGDKLERWGWGQFMNGLEHDRNAVKLQPLLRKDPPFPCFHHSACPPSPHHPQFPDSWRSSLRESQSVLLPYWELCLWGRHTVVCFLPCPPASVQTLTTVRKGQ